MPASVKKQSYSALLFVAALSGACTPTQPEQSALRTPPAASIISSPPLIRTDREEYRPVITSDAITLTVVSTYTNSTPDTITLHPCYQRPPYPLSVELERLEGNEWRPALSSVCTLALMLNPPVLLPGQFRVDTLRLSGSTRPRTVPAFAPGPLTGFYRLHYFSVFRKWHPQSPPAGAKHPLGEELPDSLRVSNVFRIVE